MSFLTTIKGAFKSAIKADMKQRRGPAEWEDISAESDDVELMLANVQHLDRDALSANPHAIPVFEKHPELANYYVLSANPNAVEFLMERPHLIHWRPMSANVNGSPVLRKHINKVDWWVASMNEGLVDLLKEYPQRIVESSLCMNKNAHLI